MSSVTERLLRFTPTKYALSLVPGMNGGAKPRVSSPEPGFSILITSAPKSASICTQVGPASTRVRSNTLMPLSGPAGSVIVSSRFRWVTDGGLRGPPASIGQGLPARLAREWDDQQAKAECNRGERDGRTERAYGGHRAG